MQQGNGFVVPDIVMTLAQRKRVGWLGGIARQSQDDRNHEALKLRRFSWEDEA
jgi:hypothetical protein